MRAWSWKPLPGVSTGALRRALPALLVIALAAGIAIAVSRRSETAAPAYTVSAASWVLPRLDGPGTVPLASFRGKPVVVDFFASWCTACRDELPELAAVSRRLQGRVAFVGVDSEENGDGLGFARRFGISSWTLARDTGGGQQNGLRDAVESVPGMPVLAIYDAGGHLVQSRLGAVSAATLTDLLRQHFGPDAVR